MTKRISDLYVGQSFQDEGELVLLLSTVTNAVSTRGDYYRFSFQDNSGSINGVMWDIPPNLSNLHEVCEEEEGIFVSFIGTVTEFKGEKQLTAKNLIVIPEDEVEVSDFIQVVPQDRGEMWEKVKSLISEVKDEDYRKLLVTVFNDTDIRNKFVNGIGGIRQHHNYIGGLLEHSIQVTIIALQSVDGEFCFPNLNRDLIITGGLLHDIGKIDEYLFSKTLRMNPVGVEHRYGGVSLIDLLVYKNNLDIPDSKIHAIKNIIMTHHGDYGDPNIRIEHPEGTVIHHADCISAFTNKHFINED